MIPVRWGSPEKPLDVRVAEALGWRRVEWTSQDSVDGQPWWGGEEPGCPAPGRLRLIPIPGYATNWAAGGPLIERFNIELCRFTLTSTWEARILLSKRYRAEGDTPLVAVCNLILHLGEVGELNEILAGMDWQG